MKRVQSCNVICSFGHEFDVCNPLSCPLVICDFLNFPYFIKKHI